MTLSLTNIKLSERTHLPPLNPSSPIIMLSKTLVALSVLALGLLSAASPTETPTSHNSIEVVAVSNSISKAPHPDIVYPNYNAIITYSQEACSGSYQITPLSSIQPNVCEIPQPYLSIEIVQVTSGQLGYGVFAALSQGCAQSEPLQYTNTCYNVLYNGKSHTFGAFYIN